MSDSDKKLLDTITTPHQLRRLAPDELHRLAEELREKIIDVVSRRGGHLASNLGVTDLTVALHYVFDFSHDRLLWDVGHQCYAHKLLTGRQEAFEHLRQSGGVSGFPAPSESPYDLFATGHAGSAISTAVGMATADQASGSDAKVVAIVGDASIVNGMSVEGLNNAAMLRRQFLVVLNDNSMAIDRTRGALAHALDRVRMTDTYSDAKRSTEHMLQHLPLGGEIAETLRHIKEGLRTTIHGGQMFGALGFRYFGPIDGHDMHDMIRILRRLANVNRPAILHVHTQKGRGCQYAVEDPCQFHSPSAYEVQGGKAVFPTKDRTTWTQAFSRALVDQAGEDERIVAITAAMPDGTGLVEFRKAYEERYFDVGICESHAIAMAAGMAKTGVRPVVAIYSTFMQRAFDQIFQEVCLQKLPILLCMDRAGLVGSDGAVHHGSLDIAYLRSLPGMVLMAPADEPELRAAMRFACARDFPCAIRYPRDEVPDDLPGECPPFEIGLARTVRQGADGTFLCYGAMTATAMVAGDILQRENSLDIGVVNARFAKPLDVTCVTKLIRSEKPLVTCEDHAAAGGFGSAVMELASARGLDGSNVRILGIPDRLIAHASRSEQLREAGLDAANLAATMRDMVLRKSRTATRKAR